MSKDEMTAEQLVNGLLDGSVVPDKTVRGGKETRLSSETIDGYTVSLWKREDADGNVTGYIVGDDNMARDFQDDTRYCRDFMKTYDNERDAQIGFEWACESRR